jgi:hypothetical protein
MKILKEDEYVNCSELIKEANDLYKLAMEKELSYDNRLYLISMNKYINKYENFREKMIKTYIEDLNGIISFF